MTLTPEGFLICHNVPIARTGTQEYLPSELPEELEITGDELVPVQRPPEEVFAAATLASFEGKPVTHDHPPDGVRPENYTAYAKGHAQNVRQGVGEESDIILADLFITDPELIRAIQSGEREVSCGYGFIPDRGEDGAIYQRSIRGNHIAVVATGRAGPRVAIKDAAPEEKTNQKKERGNSMKDKKLSRFSKMFAGWAKDAEPEEVAAAVDEIMEEKQADEAPPAPTPPVPQQDETPPAPQAAPDALAQILAALQALGQKIDQMAAPKAADEPDPVGQLADELAGETQPTQDEEAAETISDEEPDKTCDEEAPVAPAESLPKNPIPGADKQVALAALNAIKPIIAKLPPNERRAASDAAARQIRAAMGKDAVPRSNGYQNIGIVQAQASKVQVHAKDEAQLGKDIMAKHNPHYKKEG